MRRKISISVRLFAVTYLLIFIGVLVTSPTSATFEDMESLEGDLSTTDSFGEEDDKDADSADDKDEDSEAEDDEVGSDEGDEEQ
ncbi:hypothetical protein [Salicibibacter kimchii]|uniref:Uncharacterized protein n=1 Tax=Salicibibacter kimchii TaxID=2099786 RepID=A0A345C1A2_9BACI|nr:hypothetical protein [Salicibibacter kimchii]AXF56983.1 hypothetical protein DT065_13875 [Salicibibacter kimchii]